MNETPKQKYDREKAERRKREAWENGELDRAAELHDAIIRIARAFERMASALEWIERKQK